MCKNSVLVAKKHGNWLFLCNFAGMGQINEEELFRQLQARKPMAPREFYNKVLSHLESNLSCHAIRCVKLVLGEHRGNPDNEALVAQCIRWFGEDKCDFFLDGRPEPDKKLRQAVIEMIDKAKQGKSEEDGRQMCRKMAVDMMRKVHGFTKWVNGDQDYWEIPAKLLEKVPDEKECSIKYLYNTKTLEAIGVNVSKVKKDNLLVSSVEKAWLRERMMYDSSSSKPGLTPLEEYFQFFYDILKNIARFWAAQLLKLGIDMQELERETGIEFEHHFLYYVDFIPNDERCDCCVYNPAEAKELLDKIRHESNPAEEFLTGDTASVPQQPKQGRKSPKKPENEKRSGNGKPPRVVGRPKKTFQEFLKNDAPNELVDVLHEILSSITGGKAFSVILAIKDVYTDGEPTPQSVINEFAVPETPYREAKRKHEGINTYKKDENGQAKHKVKEPRPVPEEELKKIREDIKKKLREKAGKEQK